MKDGCMMLKQTKLTFSEQITLLNRLGKLLEEGYSLSDALEFVLIQFKKKKRNFLQQCMEELRKGEQFYKVLEKMNFHPTVTSYTFYGEKNGQLAKSLITAAEILAKREERKQKIKKLSTYPVFLLVMTGGMFFVISWQLLPQYMQLYNSFQTEPNQLIQLLYWAHEHPVHIGMTILLFFSLITFFVLLFQRKKADFEFQIVLVRVPVIGNLFQFWNTYYIAYHISQLLKNGISLLESIKLMREDPQKQFLSTTMEKIYERLLNGENLDIAVGKIGLWKTELGSVIFHGQKSGKLDIELEAYSQYCIDAFFELVEKMIKIIQPCIFSLIALWIILMYFSIMLPSFQMINTI